MTPTRYLASCELELGRLQEAIDNDLMGRLELLAGDALTDEASRARAHGLTDDDFADVWLTAAWPSLARSNLIVRSTVADACREVTTRRSSHAWRR